jgi:hypothetical protein
MCTSTGRPGGRFAGISQRSPSTDRSFIREISGVMAVRGAHMWHVLYPSCPPDQGEAVLTTGSHPG